MTYYGLLSLVTWNHVIAYQLFVWLGFVAYQPLQVIVMVKGRFKWYDNSDMSDKKYIERK